MKMSVRVADIFKRPGVFVCLVFIGFYRKIVSPALHALFGGDGFCRFAPTCSEYARQAFLRHGFFVGVVLAVWRIFRCHPFANGGDDPVPEKGEPLFRRPRIGVFGGSFDPVHNAHLSFAEAARKKLKLDLLIFVPAAQSPLKPTKPCVPASARVALLEAALAELPNTKVSTWEIEQGGKSFSINTVRHFETLYPRATFYWILGADQLAQLDQWFEFETLCKKVIFAAMCRDAAALPPVSEKLSKIAKIVQIAIPPIDLSSTEIRRKIREGKIDELRSCVPANVLTIILENNFYQNHADDKKNNDDKSESSRQIEADKNFREPCWNDR